MSMPRFANWTGDVTLRGEGYSVSRSRSRRSFDDLARRTRSSAELAGASTLGAPGRLTTGDGSIMLEWVRLGGTHIIRLEVQGTLEHRDVALRTVSAACRLPFRGAREDRFQEFRSHVVSAVGEAFNNIAIHGYKGRTPGTVEIEVAATAEQLSVELRDYGVSYDPDAAPSPDLEALPESGLGVFIMKSFMDRVEYTPGAPNVLKLTKLVGNPNHPATNDIKTSGQP
jgi:serine/threonine-protein kinase RsbW